MKATKMILTLAIATGLIAAGSQAQEHTGHGRRHHAQQQQQQSAHMPHYKRKVITGDEAEKLFAELSQNGKRIDNITYRCSATVLYVGRHGQSECFDRGAEFTRGSRFKCYSADTNKSVPGVTAMAFDLLHNSCGGDGIKPKRQQ